MSGTLEYAVKAETKEGNIVVLRRGFSSEESAGDHPVKQSLWKRVWVEAIGPINIQAEPALPPLPWSLDVSGSSDARGQFHLYLLDATGKKIAAIWGTGDTKRLTGEHILTHVNPLSVPRQEQP